MSEPINIILTLDRNYAQAAGVMLFSLLKETRRKIVVHMIHSDLQDSDFDKLNILFAPHENASISYYRVAETLFADYPQNGHISIATYYRLLIGTLLPETVSRAIYMDPDILVLKDIGALWDIPLGTHFIGAVGKGTLACHVDPDRPFEQFNAGVLLLNLDAWRQLNVESQIIDVIETHGGVFKNGDEEILNLAFEGRWTRLPICWNVLPETYERQCVLYHESDFQAVLAGAGVVHFLGPVKPWHHACSHPLKKQYLAYRKQTPWRDTPQQGSRFLSVLSRCIPNSIQLFLLRQLAHTALSKKIRKLVLHT